MTPLPPDPPLALERHPFALTYYSTQTSGRPPISFIFAGGGGYIFLKLELLEGYP